MAIGRTNGSVMAAGGMPRFTYTGQYLLVDDGKRNWRIRLLTSGSLTMLKPIDVDAFLVGGGGAGSGNLGGGGGYTLTQKAVSLVIGTGYPIMIGAGGVGGVSVLGTAGGATSAFGYTASGGGTPGNAYPPSKCGDGGSGGSGSVYDNITAIGGVNGANGVVIDGFAAGIGQGTTTREFGETTGTLYADGGSGRGAPTPGNGGGTGSAGTVLGNAATQNTGGGGGGGGGYGGNGGSGIVIIRNVRAAS